MKGLLKDFTNNILKLKNTGEILPAYPKSFKAEFTFLKNKYS
jgi:hypothetical protein